MGLDHTWRVRRGEEVPAHRGRLGAGRHAYDVDLPVAERFAPEVLD